MTCAVYTGRFLHVGSDAFARVEIRSGTGVLRAEGSSGTGPGGSRRTGRSGHRPADAPTPATDPGQGQPARRPRSLPGSAQVLGQGPGEPQLGMRHDDDPGPAIGRLGTADRRRSPLRRLLELLRRCARGKKRRRNICHSPSTWSPPTVGSEYHSHTGTGCRFPGRWPTVSGITVPSTIGSAPGCSAHTPWWMSLGFS